MSKKVTLLISYTFRAFIKTVGLLTYKTREALKAYV